MAQAVVTVRVMPESPAIDLVALQTAAVQQVVSFAKIPTHLQDSQTKITVQPIAFGLKAIDIIFVMDEKQGSTEPLETALAALPGVSSAQITDVRRAMG